MNSKNESALRNFEASKNCKVDNGSVKLFNADVIYENHKTGNIYELENIDVSTGVDFRFGGKIVTIADLTDMPDAFSQVSTNFGLWSCINGVLEVKGKDNTGKKGDYTMTLR